MRKSHVPHHALGFLGRMMVNVEEPIITEEKVIEEKSDVDERIEFC